MKRLIILIAFALAPTWAAAQGDTYFRGSLRSVESQGFDETITFECRGSPSCIGPYQVVVRFENCSNFVTLGGALTVTGLNLAQSGTFAGTLTLAPSNWENTRHPDGTCTAFFTSTSEALNYTATWDRASSSGSGFIAGEDGNHPFTFNGDVTAPPPIFPMQVRSQIDAVSASASAEIQFRQQDVGQNGRVFTFASAPASRVQGALAAKAIQLGAARVEPKADPVNCVLAQVSPSGQLVAVTAAQLQAYSSGVLSASGASVTILDNVPTPNVAGATFYVGYGASAQAMLDNGIFRNAVLVPGNSTCPPLPYMTSLWWNPEESGWGLNVNQQGSIAFATLFTYDAARAPTWLVMSGGQLQADGISFTGELYRTTGPAFNANPFTPIGPSNLTQVGTMTLSFPEANAGTVRYTWNGTTVQKNIQRQVYGSRSANCLPTTESRSGQANYQDLWWNSAESGWGMNITHQDNTLFATLFTYDAAGRDLWLVMSGGPRQTDGSYLGTLYRTRGSPFNAVPFTPLTPADLTDVGTMRLRFANGNSGTLTYTYNGTTVTKAITRQTFATPQSACN